MPIITPSDWAVTDEAHVVHKFGRSTNIGTSYLPVAIGEIYRTPQPAQATRLRVKAGNINDSAAGTGARSVSLQGLNAAGELITETIPTAGLLSGAASTQSFIRLFRAFVATSGTYAQTGTTSQGGQIVIENAAGTQDWAVIDMDTMGKGQTEIGLYTVPKRYKAFCSSFSLFAASTKAVTFAMVQRRDILQSSPPYSARRIVTDFVGVQNSIRIEYPEPLIFPPLTDIGMFAKVSAGTADVSVEMEISLVEFDG